MTQMLNRNPLGTMGVYSEKDPDMSSSSLSNYSKTDDIRNMF